MSDTPKKPSIVTPEDTQLAIGAVFGDAHLRSYNRTMAAATSGLPIVPDEEAKVINLKDLAARLDAQAGQKPDDASPDAPKVRPPKA